MGKRSLVFFLLLMMSMILFATIIGALDSDKNKMLIRPVKDCHFVPSFEEQLSFDEGERNYGQRSYQILTQDDARIRLRVLIYSYGSEEEIFSSTPVSVSENKDLFCIAVKGKGIHISQIDSRSGTVERTWEIKIDDMILRRSFTSSAYNWLNEEMKEKQRVHLFQFSGTMSEMLYAVDANALVEDEKSVFVDHNDHSSMLIIVEVFE